MSSAMKTLNSTVNKSWPDTICSRCTPQVSAFPALLSLPTNHNPPRPAFLLAANVVLEIEGDTSDIQSHFHTSSISASASASIGWGPFSVTGGFSHTGTQANSTCEATAAGCRITIKSPQIIGWVSQIVPALPRVSQGFYIPEF